MYDNIKVSRPRADEPPLTPHARSPVRPPLPRAPPDPDVPASAWDTNLVSVSEKYIAVNCTCHDAGRR